MKSQSYYLISAIHALKPGSEFSFIDDDYSTIQWDKLEGKAPTLLEIETKIEKIKSDEALAEAVKIEAKNALFEKLGITADEAKLLLA